MDIEDYGYAPKLVLFGTKIYGTKIIEYIADCKSTVQKINGDWRDRLWKSITPNYVTGRGKVNPQRHRNEVKYYKRR